MGIILQNSGSTIFHSQVLFSSISRESRQPCGLKCFTQCDHYSSEGNGCSHMTSIAFSHFAIGVVMVVNWGVTTTLHTSKHIISVAISQVLIEIWLEIQLTVHCKWCISTNWFGSTLLLNRNKHECYLNPANNFNPKQKHGPVLNIIMLDLGFQFA